jgi:eukaryotic-like serine/threonine-protein kinase
MTHAALRELVSSSGLSAEQTAQVLRVLEDYLAELERGGRPQPDELLARHPDLADQLKVYLDQLDLLHEAAVRFRVAEPPDGAATPARDDLGRVGDFQLLREVGRGGMGIVYEAEQISLGRRVALKVLPLAATLDPRHLQRFHNEARAAACLHHTNIVPVYAVGSERGVHFYAMQLIDGQTLAAVIQGLRQSGGKEAPASAAPSAASTAPQAALSTAKPGRDAAYFRKAAELGVQAAEALDHAHQRGIVHRDIKPANLMVDGCGNLWVADFGLAQIQTDAKLTLTGDLVGTLRYMSPEQALAKRAVVDHRTDVYSLGATLYELLTLEPAFSGQDREEILRQIAFEEPRPLRRVNRAVPEELATIVAKAMEKNPAERYGTAQDLADDLRNYLEDRPLQARRPSLRQRVQKWLRRHSAVVRSAFLLVLLAAIRPSSR